MRIGILSDIHEAVDPLRNALDLFQVEGVDRILLLGDLVETGKRLPETIDLLAPMNPIGVWGNHDWGLCGEIIPKIQERFPDRVFQFMQQLQPRIVIEECYFCHLEPWLDPNNIDHLWGWFDPPNIADRTEKSFAAVPHRRMFVGHHHRWLVASPNGVLTWDGKAPLQLKDIDRSLIVIHAVMMGHCAIYDTLEEVLYPYQVSGAEDFRYGSY